MCERTTAHFLLKHGLEDFKINVECNHAQLSGHTCEHELRMASMNGLLGNIDINTGDPTIGWDTDQVSDSLSLSCPSPHRLTHPRTLSFSLLLFCKQISF